MHRADSLGRVFVFSPGGALLAQSQASGRGAVTALAAAPVRKNETAVAAGHGCGRVALHLLEEAGSTPWLPPAPGSPSLDDETGAPKLPALSLRELWVQEVRNETQPSEEEAGPPGREVTLLEALPFAAGRLFVAADAAGALAAFDAPAPALRGALTGVPPASWRANATRPARALRAAAGRGGDARVPRRVLFVSDTGVGTFDLPPAKGGASPKAGAFRSGKAAAAATVPAVRTADCAGLNGTRISAARFENSASSKVRPSLSYINPRLRFCMTDLPTSALRRSSGR